MMITPHAIHSQARLLAAMALITLMLSCGCAGDQAVEPQQPAMALAPPEQDRDMGSAVCTAFLAYPHGVVFFFVMRDCPIANNYAPELARLIHDYRNRGFGFTLVYVDDQITLADARKHAADYGIRCNVLTDRNRALVKEYGVTISPEAALVSAHDEILYRGRIDDRYVDFGKRRAEPSQRDLREALDAVLAGEPVPNPRMPAVGCYITPQS
jgi:peroxiredoxin